MIPCGGVLPSGTHPSSGGSGDGGGNRQRYHDIYGAACKPGANIDMTWTVTDEHEVYRRKKVEKIVLDPIAKHAYGHRAWLATTIASLQRTEKGGRDAGWVYVILLPATPPRCVRGSI